MDVEEGRALLAQVTDRVGTPYYDNEGAHAAADMLAEGALRALHADSEGGDGLTLLLFAIKALDTFPIEDRWFA